ncbi:MAG: putative lipid II flippase FtsW [Gammaproteobacteria bacterium]|nr:putative lipid II flippase FtsW [Gammaproteobacteria bacterium]
MSEIAVHMGRRHLPPLDKILLYDVVLLLGVGLVMVYSASAFVAAHRSGYSAYYFVHDCVNIIVSLITLSFVVQIPMSAWQRLSPYLLLTGMGALVLVLIPHVGVRVNGSARWLSLGVGHIQPSEFFKLLLVLYLAGYLVRRQDRLSEFTHGIMTVAILLMVTGVLLLLEPDMGSEVILWAVAFGMLFMGGVRLSHFLAVVISGLGAAVALTVVSHYRESRIVGFLHPFAQARGDGYQLVQSLMAFGRGGLWGRGLGRSLQKLYYLPAAHTDFLFAIIAEEFGFVGVVVIAVLFAVILVRAFQIAEAARHHDLYSAYVANGVGLLILLEALINMGVNMGVLPTKGLALPLLSYGGSSTLVSCAAMGILLRIDRETRTQGASRS